MKCVVEINFIALALKLFDCQRSQNHTNTRKLLRRSATTLSLERNSGYELNRLKA